MNAVLTYHSIDDSGSPISVAPVDFETHLRWLAGGTVKPQPLRDLLSQPASGGEGIAVTFDDGFTNIGEPVERLLDAGITPTLFVVTGHVGKTNRWGGRDQPGIPSLPLLTWDALGRLLARGARIEAHSRTHPRLGRIPPAQLDDELGGCSEDLQAYLGVKSTSIAYPYGDVNPDVAGRASKWFDFGLTVDMGPLTAESRPMMMPRLDMYYYRAPRAMESWGSSSFRVRLNLISLRRRIKATLQGRAR